MGGLLLGNPGTGQATLLCSAYIFGSMSPDFNYIVELKSSILFQ